MKRFMSFILAMSVILGNLCGINVYAQYQENDGVYSWDFAEYAENEWSGYAGAEKTDTYISSEYSGLTLSIAWQDRDDHDMVTEAGVYWSGGASSGAPGRYIAYTPNEDGVLYATGKLNNSKCRWGISDTLDVTSFIGGSESTTSMETTTVYMKCSANTTYYIFAKGGSAGVSEVKYVKRNLEPEVTESPEATQTPVDEGFTDSDGDGIYDWSFDEYVEEWSGYAGADKTDTYITNMYKGLQLSIAWQTDSNHDKVTSEGIYWRGASEGRYIHITPPQDGILVVEGEGGWKISNSVSGASLGTTKVRCTADTDYYIVPTKSTTITHIQYITSSAKLVASARLNNMYGDNMLLQRNKAIKLDGFSEYAEGVSVTLANDNNSEDTQTVTATVSNDTWNVTLEEVSNYTDTYTLTVIPQRDATAAESETTTVKNIKFGDLYLCGGQSNMQWHLIHFMGMEGYPEYATDDYSKEEIDNCENSDIRILQLPNSEKYSDTTHSKPCASIADGCLWRELSADTVYNYYIPATVYSIATKLNAQTGVPIGILSTAVGGTTIAQWLENTNIDNYNKNKNWYNGRIYPLRNFAISGIFWYQGCSDKNNGTEYYSDKMTKLITSYRNLFGNEQLPFYYVQLARNGIVYPDTTSTQSDDNTGMREVRQAQTDVYLNMRDKTNLGFVSLLDLYGTKEYVSSKKNTNSNARVNYHTGQKPVVAQRLVDLALSDIYGMDKHKDGTTIYTHGPLYKSHTSKGNELIVEFECNGDLSLMETEQYSDNHSPEVWETISIDTSKIQEFEIAGDDDIYYKADAEISGNKIILKSEFVDNPISVRYAYSAYPECPNLTDESGLPAYAFVAENKSYPSWDFSFGTEMQDGFTQIFKENEYDKEQGYGFLGLSKESADYTAVVDGYNQKNGNYTILTEGTDYIKSTNKQYPIRFALKVNPNTYYKVKVKMKAVGGDGDITLTSERRHFVLTEEKISEGETMTKEFTVAVHNVKWKNRESGSAVAQTYTDDMLNIALLGENAALCSIEVQQIDKPDVLWIFGDSTVTDHVTDVPVSHCTAEAGWGAAAAKYLDKDTAVINLSEGGLVVGEKSYFDIGKNDISQGDAVMLQMGHNESSAQSYKEGLDYYYNAAKNAGAEFILCSPIQRLTLGNQNGPWNLTDVDNIYASAAKEYAEEKNIPYVDLNGLTRDFNTALGIKAWYTHVAYWQESAGGVSAFNDATHLNDYGADNTCRMAMEAVSELISGITAQDLKPARMPSDFIMKNGGVDYVMPPYKGNDEIFPYKNEVDFDYAVEVLEPILNENILESVKVKRNVTLSYITVFAAVYDKEGMLKDIVQKRLEPAGADTSETVDFTNESYSIQIPNNGEIRVFVWNGAFADGSMNMEPLSEALVINEINVSNVR